MQLIIKLHPRRIRKCIAEVDKIPFGHDDEAANLIASRCGEVESGARVAGGIDQ